MYIEVHVVLSWRVLSAQVQCCITTYFCLCLIPSPFHPPRTPLWCTHKGSSLVIIKGAFFWLHHCIMLFPLVQLTDPISFANYSQLSKGFVAIELESVIFLGKQSLKIHIFVFRVYSTNRYMFFIETRWMGSCLCIFFQSNMVTSSDNPFCVFCEFLSWKLFTCVYISEN